MMQLVRRERSRRRFLAAGLAGAGVLVAACGQAGDGRLPAPARGPVQLTFWKSLSGPRHEAQVRLTEAFNASQDEVRVGIEHQGEYNQLSEKLRVALASGAPPEVAMLGTNADMPAFARVGVLEPLDALAQRDKGFRLEELSPAFVRDSRFACGPGAAGSTGDGCAHPDGALYQLPFARSTPLLYVNGEALRASGLPETPPATWPAFLETAQRLVRARRGADGGEAGNGMVGPGPGAPGAGAPAGSAAPVAYGVGTSWWEFQSTLWAFGGAFSDGARNVTIASPRSLEGLTFLADLVHRHRVAVATKNAQAAFLRGEIALLTTSSANLTQIEEGASFQVTAAPLPGPPESGVPGGGAGLSLLRGTPRRAQEAGWRFLTFMTSAQSTASFAQATGYAPVRPAAYGLPALAETLRRSENARRALGEIQRVRPVDGVLAAPFANKRIEEALDAILFAGANVRETAERLAGELRRASESA